MKRHEGVTCPQCGEEIEQEDHGESTPNGSMHEWCAVEHERKNPEQW